MRQALIIASIVLFACGDGSGRRGRPVGTTCGANGDCASGICGGGACLDPAADDDRDGITNELEAKLGSEPLNADTDDDGVPDSEEISETFQNTDADGDGIPDILESRINDADGDCITDQVDPFDTVPGDDVSLMVPLVCRIEGLCATQRANLAVTCAAGVASCDYRRVVGFSDPEVQCDGADENCDGARDEGFPDQDGDAVADCVDPDFIASPPVVVIAPAIPHTDDILIAAVTPTHTPQGEEIAYFYHWERDHLAMEMTGSHVEPQLTTRGETWSVAVSTLGGSLARAEVVIANTPPKCASALLLPVGGGTSTTFTCRCQLRTDPDDDPAADVCVFWDDEEVVATVPAENGVCELDPNLTERGDLLSCDYVASDGTDDSSVSSAVVPIANTRPSPPTVSILPASGSAASQFDCSASGASDVDDDPLTYRYTWVVNGYENAGTTTTSVTGGILHSSGNGTRAMRGDEIWCRVRAFDGQDDSTPQDSAHVPLDNSPPGGGTALVEPASATEGTTLSCVPSGGDDPDGDPIGWSYTWQVDGSPVAGASLSTLTSAFFDKGDVVSCSATPHDDFDAGPSVASKNSVIVGNTLPTLVRATARPLEVARTRAVTCAYDGWWDPDPADTPNVTFAWIKGPAVGGVILPGSTTDALTPTSLRPGDAVRCRVTPVNDGAIGEAVDSNTVVIIDLPPTLASVNLGPHAAYADSLLTCEPVGANDPEGDPLTYSYAWYRGGQVVVGAQGRTLEGTFKKGDQVRCAAIPNDGYLDGVAVYSNAVTIGNRAPSIASVAVDPSLGTHCDTFTCAPSGIHDPDADDSVLIAYRWTKNDDPLPDATRAVNVTGRVAPGDVLRCFATATDGEAPGVEVGSSNEAIIYNTPPTVASVAVSPASPTVGDLLTCVPSGFADAECAPTPAFTYRWLDGANILPGATAVTLDSGTLNPGASIACRAIPFDGWDLGAGKLSEPVTLLHDPPTTPVVSVAAPDGAEGDITCVLDTPATSTRELSYQWFWRIGDGAPFTGDVVLPAGVASDCARVQCWTVVSDTFDEVQSEVAELILPFGEDCDDANPCSSDTCTDTGGCANLPLEDGTTCAAPESGCSGLGACVSGACESRWNFSRPIVIGGMGVELGSYVVPVDVDTAALIASGKMRADARDVRFTTSSGTVLPWWIETGLGTALTRFWVRVDAIAAAGVTIYLSYGNPDATDGPGINRGAEVFDLFDDFEDSVLDPSLWEESEPHPSNGVAALPDMVGGALRFALPGPCCGPSGTRSVQSAARLTGSRVAEMNMTMNNVPNNPGWKSSLLAVRIAAEGRVWGPGSASPMAVASSGWWSNTVGDCAAVNGTYLGRIVLDANAGTFAWYLGATLCKAVSGVVVDEPWFYHLDAASDGGFSMSVHDFRVRPYVAPEPTTGPPGAEAWCADSSPTTWVTTTPLPSPRYALTSHVYQGRLYAIGGHTGAAFLDEVLVASLGDHAGVGTWTATTPLPSPRATHASVLVDNRVYVIGGAVDSNTRTASVAVGTIAADGSVGWTNTTPIPSARQSAAAAVGSGYVYVVGGNPQSGGGLRDVVFAPVLPGGALGPWTGTTPLSSPREHAHAFVSDGRLYVIGGAVQDTVYTNRVEHAPISSDGTLGAWTATTFLPSATSWQGTTALAGYAYSVGGNVGGGPSNCSTRVDVAPLQVGGGVGAWSSSTALPSCRAAFGFAVDHGIFYVVGGLEVDQRVDEVLVWSAHP